jgi:hypothetical protein
MRQPRWLFTVLAALLAILGASMPAWAGKLIVIATAARSPIGTVATWLPMITSRSWTSMPRLRRSSTQLPSGSGTMAHAYDTVDGQHGCIVDYETDYGLLLASMARTLTEPVE